MNKFITTIFSVFLVAGIMGVYIPNALATLELPEVCSGNSAAGQKGSSDSDQATSQQQFSDNGAQSVSPEFNALNGNNINLHAQQNGECTLPLTPLQPTAPNTPLQSPQNDTVG